MAVCISFPGMYRPIPSSFVTEVVCSNIQTPPKARKPEERMNRNGSLFSDCSAIHPLESSSIPCKIYIGIGLAIPVSHFSIYASKILKVMTQPHMETQVCMLLCMAPDRVVPSNFRVLILLLFGFGRIYPVITAESMCVIHRISGAPLFGNSKPAIANIKAGPALLQ